LGRDRTDQAFGEPHLTASARNQRSDLNLSEDFGPDQGDGETNSGGRNKKPQQAQIDEIVFRMALLCNCPQRCRTPHGHAASAHHDYCLGDKNGQQNKTGDDHFCRTTGSIRIPTPNRVVLRVDPEILRRSYGVCPIL
jgi:hypothetical protein